MSDCTDECWAAFRAAREALINELKAARRRARRRRNRADRWRQRCNDAKDDSREAHDAWDDAVNDLAAKTSQRQGASRSAGSQERCPGREQAIYAHL